MSETTENLTIRLLQEMRADTAGMRAEVNEMRTDLTQRIVGNTLLLDLDAGGVHDHEERLVKLEGRP